MNKNKKFNIAVIVFNSCVFDNRVIKSSEAIANHGYKVTVFALKDSKKEKFEVINNVSYVRVPLINKSKIHSSLNGDNKTNIKKNTSKINNTKKVLISFFRKFIFKVFKFFKLELPLLYLRYSYRIIKYYLTIFSLLVKEKPELIHAHDLITLPLAGIYSLIFDKRFIYDSHELEMHRNTKYNSFVKIIRMIAEFIFIKKASHVITVSDSIALYLKKFYKLNSLPSVIYNTPITSVDKSFSRSLRDDLAITKSKKIIVYVGSVTFNRGLEEVIEIIKEIPELVFATVGPSNKKVLNNLKEIVYDYKIEDRVFFLDPVPPYQVVNYISSADASILPIKNVCLSYYFCMPNKLFESVFANLPLIVSDLKDISEFVKRYKCGVVCNFENKENTREKIVQFLYDLNKYRINEELISSLYSKYSWENQESKLLGIYNLLLK